MLTGDGTHNRYSIRPQEVKFASSRECLSAMRTALMECETVLLSSGEFDAGPDDGGNCTGSELADILATVAPGLREFFALATMKTLTPTSTPVACKSESRVKETSSRRCPSFITRE